MKQNCCEPNTNCSCGCNSNRSNKLCELTLPHNQFDLEKITSLVNNPQYICHCCGRLANKAEHLCNPEILKK